MSGLQLLWFILIAVLFIGFFFLEGFDFGVGMSTRFVARNRSERDELVASIGPVWDGNEVWLLTAGGALFASFPEWYATLFSGYYILLFFILVALIIRGVSFEFRGKMKTEKGRHFWDWTLFIGSLAAPFLFGMMFTSMVAGMPIDGDHNMYASFGDYVNLFSIVGGVAVTLVCFLHGLNYIRLKTEGVLRERAVALSRKLYPVLFVGLVVFAVLVWMETDFFEARPISTLVILAVIVLSAIVSTYGAVKDKEMLSFLATGVVLAGVVVLLFNGLFPRVMPSSLDPNFSLMIKNASSTPYTLKTMSIVAVTLLPFVLAYQAWTYYAFRKRIKPGDGGIYSHDG